MSHVKADCALIKKNGLVVGISLIAQAQTEAEMFCATLGSELAQKQGDIQFEGDNKIIFVSPKEGRLSFKAEKAQVTALQELLKNGGLGLYHDGCLTPGLKIIVAGMEKEEDTERQELEPA